MIMPGRPISTPLTPAQHAAVLRRRAAGVSWARIATALGVTYITLRRQCDPAFRAACHRRDAAAARDRRRARPRLDPFLPEDPRDANPLYDPRRDDMPPPQSLTAALMGDPPPGRRELLRHAR